MPTPHRKFRILSVTCLLTRKALRLIINPRRACAARVTVVGLCVCVHSKSVASHIEITKERHQRIHRNTGTIVNVADFPKNSTFKVMV